MTQFAKFEIIGRIGKIEPVGNTIVASIAANYPRKDENQQWQDDTYWNRVVIFYERPKANAGWASKGDLVRVAGKLRDTSYDKDGVTHYATDRIVEEFAILAPATKSPDLDTAEPK